MVAQALVWDGALVSTSTKPDVLRATGTRRRQLAELHGGKVYVYAPTSPGRVEGVQPVRWSPLAGCQDPRIARHRVDALTEAASTGKGIENPDHWRAGAARILRGYFLAAAYAGPRPGDLATVKRWLATHALEEPVSILRQPGAVRGGQWADELDGLRNVPERELGSFYSAAETTLAATSDPAVLSSCSTTDLDVEAFVLTRSTLYVVSPSEDQEAVAPLVAALVESIVTTTYRLHREGRLQSRVLLSLDELANIAPLPRLESIVSQGAGQGVTIAWACQSLAQLRHRYGEDAAEAIWSATSAKVVFGGLGDERTLSRLSTILGDRLVGRKVHLATSGGQSSMSTSWRPRLTAGEIAAIPAGWVLLLYREGKPFLLRAPIASKRRALRALMPPWEAVSLDLAAAESPGRPPTAPAPRPAGSPSHASTDVQGRELRS
jgi:type IV secretory pathway TraG/TraD family ATPase VirD4